MRDCLFCRIINGDIPASKVYEDDTVFAFLDIAPVAPQHILIVPKLHIRSAAEVTEENAAAVAACFTAIAKIADSLGLAQRGFRVITNSGQDGGQTVDHLHFHLLGGKPLGAMLAK